VAVRSQNEAADAASRKRGAGLTITR